ncbi:MAG TPA: alpha/beta hydrolase [Burkholderiales bacterium]|nr:alpha/beta hydrolase [Burkholderiales bacterium]
MRKPLFYLRRMIAALAGATLVGGCASTATSDRAIALAEQGYFFAGGQYIKNKAGQQIRIGQMFVQYQIPVRRTQPYPVVMWHGGGQTGSNFLGTPDGRKGWADHFLQQGYAVYVVDQPARARSGFFAEAYGEARSPNTAAMSSRFTAPEKSNAYPQAKYHTQWPGTGEAGDPVFDQFFSSQVEDIADVGVIEQLNREAGVALLDKIGPAILLTHSQSGPFGWVLANDRPQRIKGVIAIEPSGPPLHEMELTPGAASFYKDGAIGRAWGPTRGPLTYDPPAATPQDLKLMREANAEGPDLVRCWVQSSPARQLPRLKGIPILIVVSESSYHAPYDHCTAKFLAQAGVPNTFVRLPSIGIRGNGHMMMLEKNNLDVATFLTKWARENIQ